MKDQNNTIPIKTNRITNDDSFLPLKNIDFEEIIKIINNNLLKNTNIEQFNIKKRDQVILK